MAEIRPVVVFPTASRRGGVERVAFETLRFLAPRHPTTFVGYTLEDLDRGPRVRHIEPRRPFWSAGGLRPAAFRISAARCLPSEPGTVTISHGVNSPPGHVYHVHSLHRAWLYAGHAINVRRRAVPNAARYLLPRHQVLLALEYDYFRRRHPRHVIAVSRVVAHDLQRLYGIAPELITVIPNGFDRSQCDPDRRRVLRDEQRARVGIADTAIVLLFVANELHRKGLGVLLDAVARVDDERVEVHVVGRTPLVDYQAQITALDLAERVHYHGPTDDIGLVHAIADLLVLPTQYEAFALTVVEALASGVPVITTAVPGAGDRVAHNQNGLIMQDPLDAEELTALLRVALDDARRAEWSMRAPAAVADLTWENLIGRVEDVIQQVA